MEKCSKDLFWSDPNLVPFARQIRSRTAHARSLATALAAGSGGSLYRFADYHLRFGLFRTDQGWQFREWAPNARKIFIISGRTGWEPDPAFALERKKGGIFQGKFPASAFSHGDLFRLRVCWPGGEGDRIPTAARRVVQDPFTLIFNAQVWTPSPSFAWHHPVPRDPDPSLLIYEAHVGMALEQGRVGTFAEFNRHILPKIRDAGYTAIQLMAIQEHPYYGSLGYHVSSFFAPSSRFGTPEELKQLIDAAHGMGMAVFMDMVHSHAVRNEVEGLSRFDGTLHQFFHKGERGFHRLWDSRCFDYQKIEVLCFLLSNLRYWLEEFRVDGFRFDGITSMLFEDHGIDRAFTRYEDYFSPGSPGVDPDALAYLWLANTLVHDIRPKALTIAEDVSGYPGLAAPLSCGGHGI